MAYLADIGAGAVAPPQGQGGGGRNDAAFQKLVQFVTSKYPGLAPEVLQGVLGGTLENVWAQQDARQETRQTALSGLSGTLTSAATTPGMTPETLDALVGAYTAANPVLDRPRLQGQVGDIVSAAHGITSSLDPSAGAATFDEADKAAVAAAITPAAGTFTPGDDTLHKMMQDAENLARQSLGTSGVDPFGEQGSRYIAAVRQYAYTVYQRLAQVAPAPNRLGISPETIAGIGSAVVNPASAAPAPPPTGMLAAIQSAVNR